VKYLHHAQRPSFILPCQCQRWENTILDEMESWVPRLTFHTYGRLWYSEIAEGDLALYHRCAAESNARVSHLSGFKEAMLQGGRELLPRPLSSGTPNLISRRELRGEPWVDTAIHMLGHAARCSGVLHCDLEGLSPYPNLLLDCREVLAYSSVLSITLPASGGGLHIGASTRTGRRNVRPVDLGYEVGTFTIFDSFLLHRIEPFECSRERPWRMTGVMHFLYHPERDVWEYWA